MATRRKHFLFHGNDLPNSFTAVTILIFHQVFHGGFSKKVQKGSWKLGNLIIHSSELMACLCKPTVVIMIPTLPSQLHHNSLGFVQETLMDGWMDGWMDGYSLVLLSFLHKGVKQRL